MKNPRWRALFTMIVLGTCVAPGTHRADPPPADLYLEWIVDGHATTEGPPIKGRGGEAVRLEYRIRNVGGRDAFAVVVTARTALGRVGPPRRIQPGPRAGAAFDRSLSTALAAGMREICVEVGLQNLDAEDPRDPEPQNNRRCRQIEVRSDEQTANGAEPTGKPWDGPETTSDPWRRGREIR